MIYCLSRLLEEAPESFEFCSADLCSNNHAFLVLLPYLIALKHYLKTKIFHLFKNTPSLCLKKNNSCFAGSALTELSNWKFYTAQEKEASLQHSL